MYDIDMAMDYDYEIVFHFSVCLRSWWAYMVR
jgi:hypothetical protein